MIVKRDTPNFFTSKLIGLYIFFIAILLFSHTGYVEKKFEHYKDDCQKLFDKIYKQSKDKNKKEIRFWQSLSVFTFFLLLIECIYKII